MSFGSVGNIPQDDENVTASEEYGTNTGRVTGTLFAHCFLPVSVRNMDLMF
jgi:hypothetical protein